MRTDRINRREFLKKAGIAAAFCSIPALVEAGEAPGAKAIVSMAEGGTPKSNTEKAVAALGGMSAFVSRGDVVVVKPNIGWDRTPEQAANTHPDVVVAVASLCLEAGAKQVRIFDRTCNEPRRAYASSGIKDAVESFAKKNGLKDSLLVYHVDDRKFVRTAIPNALVLKEWELCRDALEADKFLNVPIAKHHGLTQVTLGLKNIMGIMGGNRGQVHFRLPEALVDVNRRVPSHLTIIDAGLVLERGGPTGGNLADVKKFGAVFASADIVAADAAVAEKVFGLKAEEVPHIRKAMESGLGISSSSQIRLLRT